MIISSLKFNKYDNPVLTQTIIVKCDNCLKEWNSILLNRNKGVLIYNKDLCRSCKQIHQYKNELRQGQSKKAGEAYSKKYKGKTSEEICGKEKSIQLKNKLSIAFSGKNNPNYKGNWYGINPSIINKGKSLEEIYGKEKSIQIKNKL